MWVLDLGLAFHAVCRKEHIYSIYALARALVASTSALGTVKPFDVQGPIARPPGFLPFSPCPLRGSRLTQGRLNVPRTGNAA